MLEVMLLIVDVVFGARIGALLDVECVVFDCVAIEGCCFYCDVVVELLVQLQCEVLDEVFVSFVVCDLVWFDCEDGYCFSYVLVRDVTYEGVIKGWCVELHECFARWFEMCCGGDFLFE